MRIRKVSASQFRCNFCLDWHVSKTPQLSSINICEQCFSKAHSSSYFKVTHPKDLEVYQVRLRKTGLVGDQARSVNTQILAELLEFYQKGEGNYNRVQLLRNYLSDCEALEMGLFRHNEPFMDFVNQVYRREMGRVQRIWENVLKQITQASKMIEEQRGFITESLESYQYDVGKDENRIFSTDLYRDRIEEMRACADKILHTELDRIKEMYVENPEKFFMDDFDVREDQTTMFQLPEVEPMSTKNSLAPPIRTDLKKTVSSQSKREPATRRQLAGKDKQNTYLDTPLSKKLQKSVSKPIKQIYLSTKQYTVTADTSRTPQSKLNSPLQHHPDLYDDFDFKNLKQWPRQQVTQLLNRRGPLPKGYKPGDQKPTILKVFPQRVMTSSICEALDNTYVGQNMVELIGYPTQGIEFLSYLEMVQWNPRVEVVKFVKVGLTDENFNLLLCFIEKTDKISTLVVSNNALTEVSIQILLNFSKQRTQLKTVYMGRNYISQQRAKGWIGELKALGVSVFL